MSYGNNLSIIEGACQSQRVLFHFFFFFDRYIFDNSVNKKKSRIKSASVDQLNIQGKLSRSDSELHAAQTKKGSINKRPEVT